MESPTLRTALPLSLLVSLSTFASRGVLVADGIIRVKGADVSSATITVVPGNAASYVLPASPKHITLELPLDDVYLISVERDGCPTKEVYFDTRVPAEMQARDFDFPFMVTLEHLDAERMFTYAAPVGFVRYVHALKDFGYETQYIIRVEEELKERMKTIRETGVDPMQMRPIVSAHVVDRPRGAYSSPLGVEALASEGDVAPKVSEVPRLVHVVNAVDATDGEVQPREMETLELLRILSTAVYSAPLAAPIPVSVRPLKIAPPTTEIASLPEHHVVTPPATVRAIALPLAQPHVSAQDGPLSRSEEIITEPRRVTRIVRFSQPDRIVHEYRKVVHAFGAVFYFQDGFSITERAFEEAINNDMAVNQ